MPETFCYPEEKDFINDKFKNYNISSNDLWLVKPSNKYSAKGITMFHSLENITLEEFVITKYITNIHLIKGKKYDLRLYALIGGLKPLRIYFYKKGSVRRSSEKYSIKENSLQNKFIHITNIGVNINNKNFISPNTTIDENANIWNILMYQNFLKRYNIEWDDIREKIKDIIIKSIISVYKELTEEIEREEVSDQSFYNLLGLDILITDKFIPKLIEINRHFNMMFRSNLEKPEKINLFIDTLNLIGIIPYSRRKKEPLNSKFKYENEVDDNINNALCELERPRGDFELIFPTRENINKYKKYFLYNSEENKIFWDKILLK